MSITGEDTRIVFVGDGNDNSPYAISFPLRVDTSVEVIYVTDATGAEVVKTITTDYTIAVSGAFTTAALTLVTTAPATGETLLIRRNEPATRLSNYKLGDGQPAAVSNDDFDKQTMADQTLQEQLDRALLVAKGHPDANLPLTPINMIGSAGAFLVVNTGETDWELSTTADVVTGSGTLNTIPLWTPDGTKLGDSIMTQSDTLITVGGTLTVNSDAVGTTILGRVKIGTAGVDDDEAVFSHFDFHTPSNLALRQSNLGHTQVNAPASRIVSLTIANNIELSVTGTLVEIQSNDFRVTNGALTVGGLITAGSGSTVLTTAAGLLRHQAIDPDIAGAGLSVASGVLSTDLSGSGTAGTIPLWTPNGSTLGDSLMTQTGFDVTLGGSLKVIRTRVGAATSVTVTNLDGTDGASDAVLKTLTVGGDPYLQWTLSAGQSYVLGIDRSDSGKLVGSVGGVLGASNWLEVTTAGAVLLTGTVSAGSSPTQITTAAGLLRHQAIDPDIAGSGITYTSGVLSVTSGLSGSGTENTIPLWGAGGVVLGDSALSQTGLNITASGNVTVARSESGGSVGLTVTNTNGINASSNAQVLITTAAATGGDPNILWTISAEQSYVLGIDNSDSDKFVGSVGAALGTTNWFEVTTARAITLDAASGQTVSLAVNSTPELTVSGTAVTIPTNKVMIGTADAPAMPLHVKTAAASSQRIRVENSEGDVDFGTDEGEARIWVGNTIQVQISPTVTTITTGDFTVGNGDLSVTGGATIDAGGAIQTDVVFGHITPTNAHTFVSILAGTNRSANLLIQSGSTAGWNVNATGNIESNGLTIERSDNAGTVVLPTADFKVATGDVEITAGMLGIGNAPTLPLDVNAKAGITDIGGIAIKLTNKNGSALIKGQLVIPSATTANAYELAGVSDDRVIGIVLEGGIADGSEAWIVVAGFAEILIDAGGAALRDRIISSTTAGSGIVSNSPAAAAHFQEVGHALEAIGGVGRVKCAVHLN